MRVVVIGGLGNFGARICKRLSQEDGFEIIATSRQAEKSTPAANVEVTKLNIDDAALAEQLKALAPDLVIHCAGPFQNQDYRVAIASLECGTHYIDLADGREFVAGFVAAVHPTAEGAGRLAITGASTLPALSSAVVDSMRKSLKSLNSIEIFIAPGQQAPRGVATMAAVFGYAGQPLPWRRDGVWRLAHGWQELKAETFSFGRRLSAACDVPDLVLLPDRYPGVQTVTFRAALEVSVQHLALWTLAAVRRIGIPVPIARFAQDLNRVGNWLDRFGSGTGGMKVRVTGTDLSGRPGRWEWELVARDNHGPEIPCMAAVLLALKLRQGGSVDTGARVCMGMISLSEFESEFARWKISAQSTFEIRITEAGR
jgi:NAD(P)-dependent dehydrogenase (short-subunit alcohol dehydrogenase family)